MGTPLAPFVERRQMEGAIIFVSDDVR